MRPTSTGRFERLEARRYLTVAADLVDGDLIIDGQADGAVEIAALEAGQFQVTDNGVVVGTLDGVTDDIRINLDADATETGAGSGASVVSDPRSAVAGSFGQEVETRR